MVKFYECYHFNEEYYLVEMVLDIHAHDIEWDKICVPQECLHPSDWQCAFMEQYLNEDGTAKICNVYEQPSENRKPCRVTFFIFKVPTRTLSTPYGDFLLSDVNPIPERLKNIIEFEEAD